MFCGINWYAHNKAFKRDLARVAFLVCVGFCVYGALQRLLYCVPAPLNAALCVFPEFIFLNQKVKIRIVENVSSGLLV